MMSVRDSLKKMASNFTVLFVEDDGAIREEFKELLERFFKTVALATNGEEGLNLYKECHYDIIITDVRMPKLDGFDMIKEIKKISPFQKVVVVSAYSDSSKLMEFINIGVDGFLQKPIKYEQFLVMLHKVALQLDAKLKEETIKRQTHDELTGLANRVKLIDDIKEAKSPILAIINIDDFSSINETFGTSLGDEVIHEVGKRVVSILPNSNTVPYRVYADEFAILVDLDKESIDDDFFEIIIKRLSGAPYFIENQEISLSFTAGVAREHINLINRASFAYKYAKQNKKSIYEYDEYLKKQDRDREGNIKWIIELKRAINEGDIVAFFQPIRNLKTGKVEKYESLVRLRKSDGTIVSPFFFLDIAKGAKLYSSITRIMFDKVLEALHNHRDYQFSINLSMLDIANRDIMDYIYKNLELLEKEHSKRIVFELTEQESLDYAAICEFSKKIKQDYGCKIAIDDFGSGYSNFEHLIELDLDYLKIDGSIIKKIAQNDESTILTEAIAGFSRKLGLKTIAEFVSSKEINDKLKAIDIDYTQGFYNNGEPKERIEDG
ncbi:MAG: EAL domain-containing protein [Campylobacterales bacterium]